MRQLQLRRRTLLTALTALLLQSAAVAHADTAGPQDAGPSLHREGTLPIAVAEQVVVDNERRHLITISNNQDGGALASFGVLRLYGGSPLHQIKQQVPSPWVFPAGGGFNPVVYAWDPHQGRLYLVAYPSFVDQEVGTNPQLLVIAADLRVVATRPLTAFPPGVKVWGMTFDATQSRLFVLGQRNADPTGFLGVNTVQIDAVDPATGAGLWPSPYAVPSCEKVVADNVQAAIHFNPGAGALFFGCGTGTIVAANEPGIPAVAVVDVRDPSLLSSPVEGPNLTDLHPLGGTYGFGESLVDQVAGKLVMVSEGNGLPAQAAWIFDEAHRAFTGVVNAGDNNVTGIGLDAETGRLFMGTTTADDEALLIGNVRFLRTPQAAHEPLKGISGPEIVVVPFLHEILIPTGNGENRVVNVYRSALPEVALPPPVNLDASTTDAAEIPGRTSSSYSGDVGAYGARIGQVGGANGVIRSVIASTLAGDYSAAVNRLAGEGNVNLNLHDSDRALYLARIPKAFLSPGEASASAVSADADSTTVTDYASASQQPWPFPLASCADFGAGATPATQTNASTTCALGAARVDAQSSFDATESLSAAITIGSTKSSTSLVRDGTHGLVAIADAEVHHVSIGGVAFLGDVVSHSETRAHGRPGTADSSYTRAFRYVTMPGFSCTTQCDPGEVVNRLRVALGGRFQIDLPNVETMRTPRGAHGSALREPYEHQQDVVVNDQPDNELQVPALRIAFVNDSATRSRFLVDLAATDASTTYSIFNLPAIDTVGDALSYGSVAGAIVNGAPPMPFAFAGPTPPSAPRGGGALRRLARTVGHGLQLLLTGRAATPLSIALWTVLLTPVYLVARRRSLLDVMKGSS